MYFHFVVCFEKSSSSQFGFCEHFTIVLFFPIFTLIFTFIPSHFYPIKSTLREIIKKRTRWHTSTATKRSSSSRPPPRAAAALRRAAAFVVVKLEPFFLADRRMCVAEGEVFCAASPRAIERKRRKAEHFHHHLQRNHRRRRRRRFKTCSARRFPSC